MTAPKLTDAQLADLLDAYAAGETPTNLAARFGIGRTYVHQLVRDHGKRCPCCRQVITAAKARRAGQVNREKIFRASANMG